MLCFTKSCRAQVLCTCIIWSNFVYTNINEYTSFNRWKPWTLLRHMLKSFSKCLFYGFFLPSWSLFFFFYQNGVVVKKIINMGQVVPTWHNFICRSRVKLSRLRHVSLKSCQLGTTSPTSTRSRVKLARLCPHHI